MSEFLSLDVEYLGFLNGELRNLKGFATLAHELIQNADDADGATEITFDIRADALVAANDGRFSDCGDMNARECLWRETRGHRCDFHRFRRTASGDKRRQENTTGAFGIGFISVYQITDRPELASRTRHWTIRPDEPAHQRVLVHPVKAPEAGTRFRLPWAREADTVMRRELSLAPVTDEDMRALEQGVYEALPSAILFLKNLDRLRLLRAGDPIRTVERAIDGDHVAVSIDDAESQEWILVRGSFEDEAARLRSQAGQQIEAGRSTDVTVAIPLGDGTLEGRFHACLPTEHPTGLPFHLDADFFPNTDRKRIVFGNDYQAEWNRAAVRAAATAVAAALPSLRFRLGADHLWRLLAAMADLHGRSGTGDIDMSFASFWDEAKLIVQNTAVVPTGLGWVKPAEAILLQNCEDEAPNLPVLEALGLTIVSPDLAPLANLLRQVGVPILSVRLFADILKAKGLTQRQKPETASAWLADEVLYRQLAAEIAILRSRSEEGAADLAACSIAIAEDVTFAPPSILVRGSSSAAKPLAALGLSGRLLDDSTPAPIADLVPWATARHVLTLLQSIPPESFQALWKTQPNVHLALLRWVLGEESVLKTDAATRKGYASLRIWPSASGLHPLPDLAVPGGFEDPLGLSDLLDARLLSDRNQLVLTDTLDVRELTIQTYATDFVPEAYDLGSIDEADSQRLEDLFAKHLGELREDVRVQQALAACPLVPCQDRQRRPSEEVYFQTELVQAVLGAPHLATVTEKNRLLLEWLGVKGTPRVDHVVERARDIADGGPPDGVRRQAARDLFGAIGTSWKGELPAGLKRLGQVAWLPVRGDTTAWHRPAELYASYNESAFASQALFLDVPPRTQGEARKLIEALGVQITPTPAQVSDHLLHLANRGERANERIYQFLSQGVKETKSVAVIRQKLQGKACLHDNGRFYRPDYAFWQSHSFGRHRVRLDSTWGTHTDLLTLLGVRDQPGPEDAIAVLRELSEECGAANTPLSEDDLLVVRACWRTLGAALQSGDLPSSSLAKLSTSKVVVNDQDLLIQPDRMFFDDIQGMAERFASVLDNHLVSRQSGVWPALEAAGVRSLRDVISARPVEAEASRRAEDVQVRLRERRPLLERAMEWKRPGAASLLDHLDGISAEVTQQLHVQYHLHAFGQSLTSDPEETAALLDAERGVLLVAAPGGKIAWGAVAREIAGAIANEEDQAHVAMALKEVLGPDRDADAVCNLDDLGCPSLEGAGEEGVAQESVLAIRSDPEEFGLEEEAAPTDTAPADAVTPANQIPTPVTLTSTTSGEPTKADPEQDGPSAAGGGTGSRQEQSLAPVDSGRTGAGMSPTQASKSGREHQASSSGTPSRDAKPSGIQSYRYVSYVGHQDSDASREGGDSRSEKHWPRRELGDLGETAVFHFETVQGRTPTKMPPMNPGYDVESIGKDGQIRYIEVKTIPADWGERGVVLSATQYACALDKGPAYWLYVVQNAGSPSAQVTCIQDPAHTVSDYAFDAGWRTIGRTHPIARR